MACVYRQKKKKIKKIESNIAFVICSYSCCSNIGTTELTGRQKTHC